MNARILIIDDNVSLTILLAKTLARFGHEPYIENNSVLAFGTIQKLMPDIILLDVMMPEKDGGKVLSEIKSDMSTNNIPVILLTGLAREAQGLANMFALDRKVIAKPVELQVLLGEIEKQLAKGRSFNEQRSHNSDQLQEEQLMQQVEHLAAPAPPAPPAPPMPAQTVKPQPPQEERLSNPFFTPTAEAVTPVRQPITPPAFPQRAEGMHHSQPDFKGLFSDLPPLAPRPGFGAPTESQAPQGPGNPFSPESAANRPNKNQQDSGNAPIQAKGRW